MLIYFAMLTFALMALAALVIDLGMAMLTQRKMQTAVDSAALEGIRFRDQIPTEWWTQNQSAADAAAGRDSTSPTRPTATSSAVGLLRR